MSFQVHTLAQNFDTLSAAGTTIRRNAVLEGSIVTSGAVTFDVQARSETGATTVTALAGSMAYVQRIA